jgi:glycosyltransferase 2 family protein
LKAKKLLLLIAATLIFVALLVYGSHRTHFRWDILAQQTHSVRWSNILIGVLLIYGAYLVRAFRWAVFLRPTKRLPPLYLLGTQVIGFTAVALLGRVADLTRPYLVARRTQLPIALQIAIYTVERMFDACSMATIVGVALLLTPNKATMPHREMAMAGARSALFAACALIVFAIAVRVAGEKVAQLCESGLGHRFGAAVASKIRGFRDGLIAVSSGTALFQAALLSLLMWGMISGAYLVTVRAFVASPVLATMTLGRAVILMAASMVGSVVPIPIVSWFAQILVLQQTLQRFYTIPAETALACGAGITFVTFLCIIPAGLIWSRFEHISLRQISEKSEQDAEQLTNNVQA